MFVSFLRGTRHTGYVTLVPAEENPLISLTRLEVVSISSLLSHSTPTSCPLGQTRTQVSAPDLPPFNSDLQSPSCHELGGALADKPSTILRVAVGPFRDGPIGDSTEQFAL